MVVSSTIISTPRHNTVRASQRPSRDDAAGTDGVGMFKRDSFAGQAAWQGSATGSRTLHDDARATAGSTGTGPAACRGMRECPVMNLLAIETSTEACSVALVHGQEVIARSEL